MMDRVDIPTGNGVAPCAGTQLLFDAELERAFVAAVLTNPAVLPRVNDVAVLDLADFHAAAAFTAIRNLQVSDHAITVESVRTWLLEHGYESAHPQPKGWPLGWLDALAAIPLPPDPPVASWAFRILDFAVQRKLAIDEASAVLEEDADIDRDALADVEDGAAHDPWDDLLKQAIADVSAALGRKTTSQRVPLFYPVASLFEREYPKTPWLVTGMVTRGGLTMLAAEPKSGKTWLACELAIAVATGTKVCGEFFAERGTVAYFFAEDLDVQVRNRVRALAATRAADSRSIGNLHVCPRGHFLDVTQDEDLAWIVASCRRIGRVDLVVLDPLRDISSASENDSDEMSPVMRRLRLIAELLGCTVAITHHQGKPSKDNEDRRAGARSRGSSAIWGSIDSGIYFGAHGGDGVSRFELDLEVEIKGARSAGRVGIVLEVTDDLEGCATSAVWTVQEPGERVGGTKHAADDDAVFAFVRDLAMRGTALSRRQLRSHDEAPLSDHRMRDALDRLIDEKRLTLSGAEVRIPNSVHEARYQ